MAVAAPTFVDVQLYFYIAKHGIKDASLSTVKYMINEAVNMDCPQLICIQLHLAASNHAVLLKRDRATKVVTGEIAYFKPLLMNDVCNFNGGKSLKNSHLSAVTWVQAYDMAQHMIRGGGLGAHYIVALCGDLKYCKDYCLNNMKTGLENRIQSYEKFLMYRQHNPQTLRIEGVFSFQSKREVEEHSWPVNLNKTHVVLVNAFLKEDAISLMPQAVFQKVIDICLGYLKQLKNVPSNYLP
ncbi:uncharacterized protein LOC126898329 [Daktulosphaira vitifoliae]|uniref:uncharacterized protein LOC126898327 n=1 Tax=Daktulosphaira vitifoliae TaxID=58002 RepID=UPI0021AA5572|nr:uncharacterized protein LOC126898327 [Daktulosphaira vitifoliae]XP_050528225.1 uncharacterized protein LOC126898329 [Daktulosphaira vitifoliae]